VLGDTAGTAVSDAGFCPHPASNNIALIIAIFFNGDSWLERPVAIGKGNSIQFNESIFNESIIL
jgi:hypothetical protein